MIHKPSQNVGCIFFCKKDIFSGWGFLFHFLGNGLENVSAVIPKCKEKFFSKHVRNFGFAKSRAKHDYVSTCLRASAWFTCQHACMLVRFVCQRGCVSTWQKCANFSFLRFNVSTCYTAYQCFNLVSQRAKRHVKFSNIPLTNRYGKFLYFIIIKNVLDFISVLHFIIKESVWKFSFLLFFSFSVI